MYAYRITIGVGKDRDGNVFGPDEREAAIKTITAEAASMFGGYTLYRTQGGWINDEGVLVTEPGITLDILTSERCGSFVNSDDASVTDTINRFAVLAGNIADQQCVVVQYPAAGTGNIIYCG